MKKAVTAAWLIVLALGVGCLVYAAIERDGNYVILGSR